MKIEGKTMKSLIICVSVSHGNTRHVADYMAEVLDAEVVEPEAVDVDKLGEYDLVGFGSGIYFMAVHARLRDLIRRLPRVDGVRAFTFFTSGTGTIPLMNYDKWVRNQLEEKGFEVLDSFSCRGLDTVGPFGFIGGINKGRPDGRDLDLAAMFAKRLRKRIAASQASS
jgi:flavodoxin